MQTRQIPDKTADPSSFISTNPSPHSLLNISSTSYLPLPQVTRPAHELISPTFRFLFCLLTMADTATAPAPAPATGAPGTPAAGAAAGAPNAPSEQNGTSRGLPYYEKLRRELRDTLQKKRAMDKSMVSELRGGRVGVTGQLRVNSGLQKLHRCYALVLRSSMRLRVQND